MNPTGLTLTVLFGAAVMFLPRRLAVLGVFAAVCYLTQDQGVVVSGFNFFAHRIILLAGLIRVLARGEWRSIKLNKIDWALFAFAIISTLVPGIRNGDWQRYLGDTYNILLSFFLFRCLVISWEDLRDLLPKLAILIIPLALCMVLERMTGHNVFDVMGERAGEGWLRNDRFRCMGAFRGPHTAGIFGATLMPLFVCLLFRHGRRLVAIAGLIAATAITVSSNSSGPLMAFLCGLVALAFWRLRHDMRRVRWGFALSLVGVALVMKAPIWYLVSKVSGITGGEGYYRSYLMEQCYKHFSDWWLMGTDNTGDWGTTQLLPGTADMCNLYVSCAAGAGLAGLILIILLLVRCFSYLGLALKTARESFPESERLLWCCGCVLFAHVCALLSVAYWDQFFVVWWGFLAMISSATSSILAQPAPPELAEDAREASADENPAQTVLQ